MFNFSPILSNLQSVTSLTLIPVSLNENELYNKMNMKTQRYPYFLLFFLLFFLLSLAKAPLTSSLSFITTLSSNDKHNAYVTYTHTAHKLWHKSQVSTGFHTCRALSWLAVSRPGEFSWACGCDRTSAGLNMQRWGNRAAPRSRVSVETKNMRTGFSESAGTTGSATLLLFWLCYRSIFLSFMTVWLGGCL